jgi:hypothetical protein
MQDVNSASEKILAEEDSSEKAAKSKFLCTQFSSLLI